MLVVAEADIAVHKAVDNATPLVGQTVTFTVTATNNGPHPATGVQLSDGVPLGLTLVLPHPVPPSQGTYTPDTGVWDLGALAVGAQATLTLVARGGAGRADTERGHEDCRRPGRPEHQQQ